MSDVSSVTSLIPTANEGFITTVGGTGVSSGGTTVPLTAMTGLVNGTVFVGIVEPGLAAEQTFTGIVDTGGSQITSVVWTRGTNAAHAAGKTVVDYVTGTHFNMLAKAVSTHTDQDGTLKAGSVDSTAILADNVVTGDKIVDGTVTPDKLSSAISAVTWTPTVTNITVGNGTLYAFYSQVGAQVTYYISFVLGSTSAVGTAPIFTPPVNPGNRYAFITGYGGPVMGQVICKDASTESYLGVVYPVGNSLAQDLQPEVLDTSGATATSISISATVPFTWATGDSMYLTGSYTKSI